MRAYTKHIPEEGFEIRRFSDRAEIVFYCEVIAEGEGFSFEEKKVSVPWRNNLYESVRKNRAEWFALAERGGEKPLPPAMELCRLRRENELMGEALTQLICEVMK